MKVSSPILGQKETVIASRRLLRSPGLVEAVFWQAFQFRLPTAAFRYRISLARRVRQPTLSSSSMRRLFSLSLLVQDKSDAQGDLLREKSLGLGDRRFDRWHDRNRRR